MESLDFIEHAEDVVMFGPPGTGKTHLATALGRKACRRGIPVRFFTAAELVMRLLRASTEGRLDRELAMIGKAGLIILDELGYVPIDEEGSRLLFQVVTNAYERQSIVHDRQHRVQRMGQDLRRPQHGAPLVNRPYRPPRQDDQIRGRQLPQDPRPHAITNKHNQTGPDRAIKRQQTNRSPGQLSHDQTGVVTECWTPWAGGVVIVARYSREQRRRAVELYERYEHSAADVIRELGYPSKEALRMWHRDWLEERRTGIPSSRGERYSRYTDGQRRAAVEHYLTHGRRSGRTMRRMGYPSREVLAAWIDGLAPGERVTGRGPVADEVRRMAVARLVAGGVTSRQVAAEVGVEASVVRNRVASTAARAGIGGRSSETG